MRTTGPQWTTARSGLQAVVPLYLDQVAVDERGLITEWRVAFLPEDVDPVEIARALRDSINLEEPHRCRIFDNDDCYLAGHPGNPPHPTPHPLTRLARRALGLLRGGTPATRDQLVAAGAQRWPPVNVLRDLLAERGAADARGQLMVAGRVRVEWSELGEGHAGDYDPTDPDDTELLRFDFSALVRDEWLAVSNASYCTQVPATTSAETRRALVALLLAAGAPSIEQALDRLDANTAAAALSAHELRPPSRRLFEHLSSIAPSWAD